MKKLLPSVLICVLACLVGCTEQTSVDTRFDAKEIASEADGGNLGPLKVLNDACAAEIKSMGRRGEACKAQDDVGLYMKPFNLRF